MKVFRLPLLSLTLLFPVQSFAQETATIAPTRDPVALSLMQKSIAAMGTVSADSVATGSVVIVAGSDSDKGTIRIFTRGTAQTSEEAQLSQGTRVSRADHVKYLGQTGSKNSRIPYTLKCQGVECE